MTKEQYNIVLPFKAICNLFATKGSYRADADGLFIIYKDMFNGGKAVDIGCINCISAVLIDVHNKIERYESQM